MVEDSDSELHAISAVIGALEKLDAEARVRVLEYVIGRLGAKLSPHVSPSGFVSPTGTKGSADVATVQDIKTLRDQKAPASMNEMTALVAYYVAELAPSEERHDAVDSEDVMRYFKHAKFPLPSRPRDALVKAKNAGYLDESGEKGRYKLSSVGYNLVVHQLPKAGPTT